MITKLFIALLLSITTLATTAIIRVHEAPVLDRPTSDGLILMRVRKGREIYLHPNHLNDANYYVTLTRDGRKAYINKRFVKLVLNNDSEDIGNTIYVKNDPTDYVIDEPLPERYPLKGFPNKRAQFDFILKKGMSSRYGYTSNIERESSGFSGTINIKYLRPANFDDSNRLYYGFFGSVSTEQNEYLLTGDIFTKESSAQYALGPVVSYTFYKRQYFEIESMLQVGLNFQRTFISQEDNINNLSEEKLFSGINFNLRLSINLSHKKVFNSNSTYFYHGPVIDIRLPSTLESDGQFTHSQLWSSPSLSTSLEGTFGYNLGITYRY